jgi:hypothetical protein
VIAAGARQSLKEIAVRAHVKVGRANMSIRLVKDNFDVRCTFKIAGLKCEVYANPSLLYAIVHTETTVLFATPRRSAIHSTGLLLGQFAGCDVFVNAAGRGSPSPWIHKHEAIAALRSLQLEGDDQLTVAMNGPRALLRSAGLDADWERLQKLVALARILPPGAIAAPLDLQVLPEDLRDLFPLLAHWAVSDDQARSDRVGNAKTAALQRLVDRVEPRLPRVAAFLNAHDDEDSLEASGLDALAQTVMEAQQELTKRRQARTSPPEGDPGR